MAVLLVSNAGETFQLSFMKEGAAFANQSNPAELVSGALSMALGGYLAARSEMEHYKNERRREEQEQELYPEEEEDEIVELFESYGMDRASLEPMLAKLRESPERAVDFHMRFELNLEKPDPNRSWVSTHTSRSLLHGNVAKHVFAYFLDVGGDYR